MQAVLRSDFSTSIGVASHITFYALDNTLANDVNGRAVSITPLVARVLLYLAAHPNMVLARTELIEAVWGQYGFVVCQNSLNQTIRALRAAFLEINAVALSIKTVPRIGYVLDTHTVAGARADRRHHAAVSPASLHVVC